MINPKFQEIINKYSEDLPIPCFSFEDQSFIKSHSYSANLQPYTNKATHSVYNHLVKLSPEFSPTRKNDNKNHLPLYDLQAQVITYLGALTVKHGYTACKFPFAKTYYNILNNVQHRKDDNCINYDHTMTFINRLVENGYCTKIKGGAYESDNRRNHSSVLVFTEKFLKLFDGVYLKDVKPQIHWFELRERKDKKDDKKVVARNDEVSFSNSKIYKRAIGNLNKLCREQKITMNGYQWKPQYQALGLIDSNTKLEDWDRNAGMRIYGGSFQCEPSGKLVVHKNKGIGRQTLRINNLDTVEADFSGMHIATCYIKSGEYHDPDLDMYALQFTDFINPDHNPDELRQITKMAVNMMFNAKTDKGAKGAIQGEYNRKKSSEYASIKSLNIQGLMDEIKRIHEAIAHYFCSDAGVKLQVIDSEIAIRVVDHFTKKGIIALPYHDSFIVEAQHRDELINVMKNAWAKVLKKTDLCKIKVELHSQGIAYVANVFEEVVDRYEFSPFEVEEIINTFPSMIPPFYKKEMEFEQSQEHTNIIEDLEALGFYPSDLF